jgi:hypothetical protein
MTPRPSATPRALKTKAIRSFETSRTDHPARRGYIPQEKSLQPHLHEKLQTRKYVSLNSVRRHNLRIVWQSARHIGYVRLLRYYMHIFIS